MPDEREIRKEAYAEGRNIGLGIGGVAGLAFGYYWGQRSFLFAAALFIGGALLFVSVPRTHLANSSIQAFSG
jgi:hypothetical protein